MPSGKIRYLTSSVAEEEKTARHITRYCDFRTKKIIGTDAISAMALCKMIVLYLPYFNSEYKLADVILGAEYLAVKDCEILA